MTAASKTAMERPAPPRRRDYDRRKKRAPIRKSGRPLWRQPLMLGLVVLLMLLAVPAARAWKHKNYLFVSFCVIIALNCMTESVLEVQKGVMFFALFGLLLFHSTKHSAN